MRYPSSKKSREDTTPEIQHINCYNLYALCFGYPALCYIWLVASTETFVSFAHRLHLYIPNTNTRQQWAQKMEYAFDEDGKDPSVSEPCCNDPQHPNTPIPLDNLSGSVANLDLLRDSLLGQPGLIPSSNYAAEHWRDARERSFDANTELNPVCPPAFSNDTYDGAGWSVDARWNEFSFGEGWQLGLSDEATGSPYLASRSQISDAGVVTPASEPVPIPKLPKKTKKHRRLSTEAVKILKSWLYTHQHYPYPTEQEKYELERQTALDRTQISNWFINARRRKRLGSASNGTRNGLSQDSSLTPMERWQNSPPESEAAMPSDILRALATAQSPFGSAFTLNSEKDRSSAGSTCPDSAFYATSASSLDFSQSSTSELSVAHSHRRHVPRPPTPVITSGPRRRRRKIPKFIEMRNGIKRLFQCTFCADSFATRYDWQRHEKALHMAVERWICAPRGGIAEVDGVKTCVFCGEQGADEQHLEEHNYSICRDKSPEQQGFHRKDHLRQHLRLTHNVAYHPSMDEWREAKSHLASRCGFCNSHFTTWEERVDHLADHFRNGADMVQWKGDWGFEPAVQAMIENAIPPYLIGQEQKTPDPWKTSGLIEEDVSMTTDVPNGLHRYVSLREHLIAYLREKMAAGQHPSDEEIQDEGRRMAYGTNDRWNLTYADDQVWLDVVKREAGLGLDPQKDLTQGDIEEQLRCAMDSFMQCSDS